MIELDAEAGKTYTFYKYFAVYTDNDPVKTTVNEAAISTSQKQRLWDMKYV